MRNDLERDCLVQLRKEETSSAVVISFGLLSQKGNGHYVSARPCFFKARESFVIKTNVDSTEDPLEIANKYLARIRFVGNVVYDPDGSFETEEPNHIEIFMGTGAYIKTPGVAYTRDIGPCMGIGFYNPRRKMGSLFHIAGAEDSSIQGLAKILDGEVKRLGSGLDVRFVSGLGTIDSEALAQINDSRQKAKELLGQYAQHFSNVGMTLCEAVGEIIKYFSLYSKTGLYTITKDIIPYQKLVEMDDIASRRFKK